MFAERVGPLQSYPKDAQKISTKAEEQGQRSWCLLAHLTSILRRLFSADPINPKVLVGRGVCKRFEQRYGKVWRARRQVFYGDGPIADENGVMLPGQGDGFGQTMPEVLGR